MLTLTDATQQSITFTVGNADVNLVAVFESDPSEPTDPSEPADPSEPTDSTESTKPSEPEQSEDINSPATGDNSNILLWTILMLISAVGLVCVLIAYRYKGKYGG